MFEQSAIFITAIFVLLQFLFTCLFFKEKHREVAGMGAFALSALMLLLTAVFGLLYSSKTYSVYLILSICSFAAIYYGVIRSFTQLLSIRSNKSVECYYFLSASVLTMAYFGISAEPTVAISLGIIILAIVPLIYLLRLIASKVRYSGLLAERTFVSHCISLLVIGYLILFILLLLDAIEPLRYQWLQQLPSQLTASVITVSVLWGLCAHISLLIAFLIVVYSFKQDELKKAGETDYLTGVYNRKAFFDRLSGISDTNHTYFILIDADYFKKINDQHGHVAGDAALKHIAAVVQANISKDDLLARYGGEEFIIAVVNTDERKLKIMVERVRSQMERTPLEYNGVTIPITLSIGVSKYTKTDILRDIERADTMLYQAKSNGRNQAMFSFS